MNKVTIELGYCREFIRSNTNFRVLKTLVREGIQVSAGFTATLNIQLEVATVAETITVQGDSPIVDTTSASVATNFNPIAISVIPNGHDIFSVLALTPGVQMTVPDVGGSEVRQRPSFRSYGSTSQWNVIDGAIVAGPSTARV